MQDKHHPSRNSVMTYHDNRSVILFVTVIVDQRLPVLANDLAHACTRKAWQTVCGWIVGRYVIMPDHLHFFCSPATFPPEDFHRWVRRWKAQVSRTFPMCLRVGWARTSVSMAPQRERSRLSRPDDWAVSMAPQRERSRLSRPDDWAATSAAPPAAAGIAARAATSAAPPAVAVVPKRFRPLFQPDCWDRQLRSGESYSQKWQYVRNNPVRKGLVANADDWPYQGEMNVLQWHERE